MQHNRKEHRMGMLDALALGLVSGAGQGLATSAQEYGKYQVAQSLQQQASDLAQAKQIAIDQATYERTNAPLDRAGQAVKDALAVPVQVIAPAITSLSGDGQVGMGGQEAANPNSTATPTTGLQGNLKQYTDIINDPNTPADVKAGLTSQLNAGIAYDQAAAQKAVAGQTVMPTRMQALESTKDAMLARGDAQGAAAISTILNGENIIIPRGGSVYNVATGKMGVNQTAEDMTNARVAIALSKNDQEQAHNQAMENLGLARVNAQIASAATPKDALRVKLDAINDPSTPPDIVSQLKESLNPRGATMSKTQYLTEIAKSAALGGQTFDPIKAAHDFDVINGKTPVTQGARPLAFDPATGLFK